MSKKAFKLSLILAILVVTLSACTFPWQKKSAVNNTPVNNDGASADETASSTKQIKKFNNYDELKTFLEENNNTNSQGGFGLRASAELSMATGASSPTASTDSAVSSPSLDYSTTNNQVAGVDEADIIKTDGNYIYALVKNDLKIIKANPANEATVVSTITFKSRPQDIFIDGTNLSVFGADQQIYAMDLYKSFRRQNPYTFFKVYDLVNPADPKLVRDLNFEGSYTDARLIGDYVYLFTNSYENYIENEPLVPRVLDNGLVLSSDCSSGGKCFAPDIYYFDIPYNSYSFSNVTAINIKDNNEALSGQSFLMNYGQNLYVSQNNIYISYTETLNEYDLEQSVKRGLVFSKLSSEDQDKINKIEAVASYILNKNEKTAKVISIIDHYISSLSEEGKTSLQTEIDSGLKQKLSEQSNNMEKTVIHKIGINGNKIEYRGMGEVSGQVLNQFSMDESNNYFRIATTRSQIWSRLSDTPSESYSNVYVLDNDMKVVGSLENLATSERIYSARFMGDRAYLVTFKQTDPLYVIGLSDPTKPSVLGALQVPGFSTYLHPADANGNKLIGFGRDVSTSTDGSIKINGLKLALFDFTDLAKPRELDSYLIGNADSDSIALQDHKAFLYSESKNLLSIPAVLRDNNKITFGGSLVFGLIDNKFVLKGKIDHSEGGIISNNDYWGGYDYYDNTVKRSLYINDNLYTFSNRFLKINSLADLSSVKNLILTSSANDYTITPAPTPTPASIPYQTPALDGGGSTTSIETAIPAASPDLNVSTSSVTN